MNQIDKKFQELVVSIARSKKEEVFNDIKEKYKRLPKEIKFSLEDYYRKFTFWGKLNEEKEEYESLYLRAETLKEHLEDFLWLYNKLTDYRSKKLLYSILNNWYTFTSEEVRKSLEYNYLQYCDLDILKLDKNEIIIDIGAYTGDSISSFINEYGIDCYKKIIAYEITPESIETLKNSTKYYPNIEIRKKAVINEERKVFINLNEESFSANKVENEGEEIVEGVTLDKDLEDNPTLIKMDIEGGEAKALLGAKEKIENNTPKLLISVYHGFEDLWKIPRMIEDMNNNYNYYLRCYGTELFYPPLGHYSAAYINTVVDNPVISLEIVHFLGLIFSGITMYYLAKTLSKNRFIGLLSAVIYMLFPYHLSNIYVRDALGESLLFIFLPLIFLGLYELFNDNIKKFYPLFIIGYVGGMLSHLIMMCYLTVIILVFLIIKYKTTLKYLKQFIIASLFILSLPIVAIPAIIPTTIANLTQNFLIFLCLDKNFPIPFLILRISFLTRPNFVNFSSFLSSDKSLLKVLKL